jgi:hypothetical protein
MDLPAVLRRDRVSRRPWRARGEENAEPSGGTVAPAGRSQRRDAPCPETPEPQARTLLHAAGARCAWVDRRSAGSGGGHRLWRVGDPAGRAAAVDRAGGRGACAAGAARPAGRRDGRRLRRGAGLRHRGAGVRGLRSALPARTAAEPDPRPARRGAGDARSRRGGHALDVAAGERWNATGRSAAGRSGGATRAGPGDGGGGQRRGPAVRGAADMDPDHLGERDDAVRGHPERRRQLDPARKRCAALAALGEFRIALLRGQRRDAGPCGDGRVHRARRGTVG